MKNRLMALTLAGVTAVGTIAGGVTAFAASNNQAVEAEETVSEVVNNNTYYCSPALSAQINYKHQTVVDDYNALYDEYWYGDCYQNSTIEYLLDYDADLINAYANIDNNALTDAEALAILQNYDTIQMNMLDCYAAIDSPTHYFEVSR